MALGQGAYAMLSETRRQIALSQELYKPQVELGRWLESELQRQSRDGIEPDGPVIGPFRVLRRLLTEHFDYEEHVGFFAMSKELLPDDADAVDRLILQHANFRERMHAIENDLESAERYDEKLMTNAIEDVRCLFQDLHQHDLEENKLLRRLAATAS